MEMAVRLTFQRLRIGVMSNRVMLYDVEYSIKEMVSFERRLFY